MKYLIILLAFSSNAQASLWIDTCGHFFKENWSLQKSSIKRWTSDCSEVPLTIGSVSLSGSGPFAWYGGFKRSAQVIDVYRVTHNDYCTDEILWTETKSRTYQREYIFNVGNPNLEDFDAPTYVINAPMTDEEARADLPATLARCMAATTGIQKVLKRNE